MTVSKYLRESDSVVDVGNSYTYRYRYTTAGHASSSTSWELDQRITIINLNWTYDEVIPPFKKCYDGMVQLFCARNHLKQELLT